MKKAKFYINQTSLTIDLQSNERLFLLSGTITDYSDEQEIIIDSIHFILHDYTKSYRLNSTSIVYIWTYEDEIHYSKSKKFKS